MNKSQHDNREDIFDKADDKSPLDIRAINNWRIFRIMAELVEGWQFLSHYDKKITVFGSARLSSDNKWYKEAVKLGKLLAEDGYNIVTGGGPGIMEAANKGAHSAREDTTPEKEKTIGESIGLDIELPLEQRKNEYVRKGRGFNYFFVRKVMLSYHARGYVFFPGGFGTLDEAFEILTLVQTHKLASVPIVLMGKDFWNPLAQWLNSTMSEEYKTIDKEDLNIFKIVDTAEEAYQIIKSSVK